ncbi:thermonuclease family protein [Halobacteriovorax sp. DPLXC-1]|uniref:thermonuclease family protein n=1 Tax=Halobacteriovorax sp. DPLXC-1 TaxID=3110771 RepID=UPI002FF40610
MRYLILFFSFSLILSTHAARECSHDASNFRCVKFVKNYDADTVTFDIPNVHPLIGSRINIRVSGVDTPEIRTKNTCEKRKGYNAKKIVRSLLKNAKRIDLENVQRGKYFRVVADVKIDGQSLSFYLLKNGLAYAYDGGTKKKVDWCKSNREIASEN